MLVGVARFVHPVLAFTLLLAFVTVGVVVPIFANRRAASLAAVNRAEAGKVATSLVDSIHGAQDVLTLEREDERLANLSVYAAKADVSAVALARLSGVRDGINAAVISASLLMTAVLGVQLVADGKADLAHVAAVIVVALVAFDPLRSHSCPGSVL